MQDENELAYFPQVIVFWCCSLLTFPKKVSKCSLCLLKLTNLSLFRIQTDFKKSSKWHLHQSPSTKLNCLCLNITSTSFLYFKGHSLGCLTIFLGDKAEQHLTTNDCKGLYSCNFETSAFNTFTESFKNSFFSSNFLPESSAFITVGKVTYKKDCKSISQSNSTTKPHECDKTSVTVDSHLVKWI